MLAPEVGIRYRTLRNQNEAVATRSKTGHPAMELFGRFFPRARFFGGTDVDVVSDCREADEIAGADTETAADFRRESDTAAAEHGGSCDGFHWRFLDCLAWQIVSQFDW
jgi:hypothetical protein